MQLNTLNRVIALFLIGGFVVVLGAVALEPSIGKVLEKYSKIGLGPAAGVFLAVALLSITALAGTVVDAIGNLTIRRWIKVLSRTRARSGLLFCTDEFDEQNRWQAILKDALENAVRHKALARREDMMKPLSAAIFFRTAEKEHTEWLIQHHSMYHLSANFVVILIALSIWLCAENRYWAASGSVLGAYLLTTFALDNYLYAYQLTFRNAYLIVTDRRDEAAAPPETPNPKLETNGSSPAAPTVAS